MSSGVKAAVSYDLKIDVSTGNDFRLNEIQDKNLFSLLANMYAKSSKDTSLKKIEKAVNDFIKRPKNQSKTLLKGLYSGGTNGMHNVKTAPFLFFDIDVKKNKEEKENTHLFSVRANQRIFEELQKVAVLVWRSNSGNGIAGILYVPQIAEFTNNERSTHKKVGEAVTAYLSNYLQEKTGIAAVQFDQAQSKFRQVRHLAEQTEKRALNPDALAFHYSITEIEKKTKRSVPIYYNANFTPPYGSVIDQFNNDNPILTIAEKAGFEIVNRNGNEIRVKHPLTTNPSSGVIITDKNTYFNFSGSYDKRGSFKPADIVCKHNFEGDYKAFCRHLYKKGYKDKSPSKDEIKAISEELKSKPQTPQLIYEHCYNLQTAPDKVKEQFIKDTCTKKEDKKYFFEYLKYSDYSIHYRKTLNIKQYVSEAIPEILNFADQYKRVIVRAETGTGKTHAVINEIHKYRPDARLLILAPLTLIVEQQARANADKGVYLTGKSTQEDREKALESKLVFATYEQGTKYLQDSNSFSFVIVDEIHELITANSYKHDVIKDLSECFNDKKIIGLTATPLQIFNKLGYEFLNVKKKNQKATPVEIRYSNINPFNLALSHLIDVKGKTILRINSIDTLKDLKKHLIRAGKYKADEIVILYSTKDIKNGKDYNYLADKERFTDNTKLVLTTAIIDEGINIRQNDFTDSVFIETSYTPRPEAIKQFFARFRTITPQRKNYLYLRERNDQTATKYKPLKNFEPTKEALILDKSNDLFNYSSYGDFFNNDRFYYNSGNINSYYLAYHVTKILFLTMNSDQFRYFLAANYNLTFTINDDFVIKSNLQRDTKHKDRLKYEIAKAWKEYKNTIQNTVYYHTQDKKLKRRLTLSQAAKNDKITSLVLNYLKEFESLIKKSFKLIDLGEKQPDKILISKKINLKNKLGDHYPDKEDTTLISESNFKKGVTVLELKRAVLNPKNETDKKNMRKLLNFIDNAIEQKEMSRKELYRLLKKHKVFNSRAFDLGMLKNVFDFLNVSFVYDDHHTGLIKISYPKKNGE